MLYMVNKLKNIIININIRNIIIVTLGNNKKRLKWTSKTKIKAKLYVTKIFENNT